MRREHALGLGLLAVLAGCDGNGYQMVDRKMAYQTWDAGNGTQTTYLRDVDAGSFKSLSNADYGKDNKQVYYRGVIVWGADPALFEVLNAFYAKDELNVYFRRHIIPGADSRSFRLIDDSLARDDLHRYHFGERKPLNYLAPR